ncbi:unnamed protein product, partial [Polarella glacialis]
MAYNPYDASSNSDVSGYAAQGLRGCMPSQVAAWQEVPGGYTMAVPYAATAPAASYGMMPHAAMTAQAPAFWPASMQPTMQQTAAAWGYQQPGTWQAADTQVTAQPYFAPASPGFAIEQKPMPGSCQPKLPAPPAPAPDQQTQQQLILLQLM